MNHHSRSPFDTLQAFSPGPGRSGHYYALAALERAGVAKVSRLPVSLRLVLEAVLRHCDGHRITEEHVRQLANWAPRGERTAEIPFVVARIVLQDFTGVPLLCDLAAMRGAAARMGRDPKVVEPRVPVDLVVDHSVQVDHAAAADALDLNMKLEFRRNAERYTFIKWGMQAFETFRVVPPGVGIVHQVNLEHLARGVLQKDGVYFPDTLVGTDSHTTMINALGVVGWGVGGIEAEAGMLGQPIHFLTPDVVGVHLRGRLRAGVTATDLVLAVTQRLRQAQVVGKFVEFFGDGAARLTVPDRATIANMAPEYGATTGFFPVDEETIAYLAATGRSTAEIEAFRAYFVAQQMFGMPREGEIDYSETIEIDLDAIVPAVAGPKRPQDLVALPELGRQFARLLGEPVAAGGYGLPAATAGRARTSGTSQLAHGDVLIAAITSCTNTSNPGVMLAAGLLAKKALARGLRVAPRVKTSLAPGSRVVTDYLSDAGLLPCLEELGFHVVAYGCTTCIGNSGPLDPAIEAEIGARDLVCAAVLSGNRNFEARIHPAIRANFLMSPPLVVAFALAGRVDLDLGREPLGHDAAGRPVYLHEVWPTPDEVAEVMRFATRAETYRARYAGLQQANPHWDAIPGVAGQTYDWRQSTYIAEPPFLANFALQPPAFEAIAGARALAFFGDSVTTDHISPAGAIPHDSPAGRYLLELGVAAADFNSYGARRGHHEVMVRGTFANVRIRNLMLPPDAAGRRPEGGHTVFQPDGRRMTIHEAAIRYRAAKTPTLIFAGEEYGTGSSRDWAAKGTALLGVRAVVARSFERIHRANLVGMGVLPLQFIDGESVSTLGLDGSEIFDLADLGTDFTPQRIVRLILRRRNGQQQHIPLRLRVDTPVEAEYLRHGGLLPYVLRQLLAA